MHHPLLVGFCFVLTQIFYLRENEIVDQIATPFLLQAQFDRTEIALSFAARFQPSLIRPVEICEWTYNM